jgi:hypothetical protein
MESLGGDKLSVAWCQPRELMQLVGRQESVVVSAALKKDVHEGKKTVTGALARHRHEHSGRKERK